MHKKIIATAMEVKRTSLDYFTKDGFLALHEIYLDTSDFVVETLSPTNRMFRNPVTFWIDYLRFVFRNSLDPLVNGNASEIAFQPRSSLAKACPTYLAFSFVVLLTRRG